MDRTERGKLQELISYHVDKFCEDHYDDGHRHHLGASLIGHECSRKLWYTFRWVYHHKHPGRMQRLFNRGHREEERFCEWLRGIGAEVFEFDENGKQHRVTGVQGHFGGSMDGIVTLEKFGVGEPLLLEFKTSATGATFNKLKDSGVKCAKPQHFAQMSVYGMYRRIKFALYMAINKNDDDIHIEIVELDWELGKELERKAEHVIFSQEPPERAFSSESYFECKWCEYRKICWNNENIELNCRSCSECKPIANGEWQCSLYGVVPKQHLIEGCGKWKAISS